MAVTNVPFFAVDGDEPRSGSALADFLYPKPARRTVGGIFKWWERRRLAYNAIISAGGAASLSGIWLTAVLHGEPVTLPWLLTPVIAVLLAANACYTLGPIVESLAHKLWGRQVLPVGPHLFRAGLTLSVGVTLVLPMLFVGFSWVLWVLLAIM